MERSLSTTFFITVSLDDEPRNVDGGPHFLPRQSVNNVSFVQPFGRSINQVTLTYQNKELLSLFLSFFLLARPRKLPRLNFIFLGTCFIQRVCKRRANANAAVIYYYLPAERLYMVTLLGEYRARHHLFFTLFIASATTVELPTTSENRT